jgi:putative restriction endonuclease
LIFESEKILAKIQETTIENKYSNILKDIENLEGETKIRAVKTRVNQNVFRQIVLANYTGKCAVTGFNNGIFLIASHIIPWSVDKKNRLNPQNGILLNSLHDRAFENGFMTIDKDFDILICSEFLKSKDNFVQSYFSAFHKKKIQMPVRFLPDTILLEKHFEEKFLG